MRALTEWKDAGGNVADVMLAIEFFMQARIPVIVSAALSKGVRSGR